MSNKKKKNSNYQTKNASQQTKKSNAQTKKTGGAAAKKLSDDAKLGLICVAVILIAVIVALTFCTVKHNSVGDGACIYATTRNVEGHEMKYVKMMVKGHGGIILALDATTAPKTVDNFMRLVNEGFYNGLTFHRIVENFMIQGGDPDADGSGGSDKKVEGEFSNNGHENDISHLRGVLSMARSGHPYTPSLAYNTASSQFFICNADSTFLDGDYAAFGYVLAGLDVVDSITKKGVKHTVDEVIENKRKQPVIKSIVEITEEEAMKYVD